jgi:hypothetical protein
MTSQLGTIDHSYIVALPFVYACEQFLNLQNTRTFDPDMSRQQLPACAAKSTYVSELV